MRIIFHGEHEPGGGRLALSDQVLHDDVAQEVTVPAGAKWLQLYPPPVAVELVTGSGPCGGENCRHVSHAAAAAEPIREERLGALVVDALEHGTGASVVDGQGVPLVVIVPTLPRGHRRQVTADGQTRMIVIDGEPRTP